MVGPPWVADRMLGRLARYLRILGQDTVLLSGVTSAPAPALNPSDGRTLLTRSRELARTTPGSLLIRSKEIAGQLREVRHAVPDLPLAPSFARCTVCNGRLRIGEPGVPVTGVPDHLAAGALVYRCDVCGHLYWEGSHTEAVRRSLAEWFAEPVP